MRMETTSNVSNFPADVVSKLSLGSFVKSSFCCHFMATAILGYCWNIHLLKFINFLFKKYSQDASLWKLASRAANVC